MTTPHDKTEALKGILRGFGQSNHAALERLSLFEDWQRVASAELERRATQIVEALDDQTLQAIAAGEIDFQAACREVAHDIALKAA